MTRIMAIDLGKARTGVAVSDELGMLAQPWKTLPGGDATLEAVAAAVQEIKPGRIIVGLPRNMDGSFGPAAEAAKDFAGRLREHVSCPVDLWDERLTTVAAQRRRSRATIQAEHSCVAFPQATLYFMVYSGRPTTEDL